MEETNKEKFYYADEKNRLKKSNFNLMVRYSCVIAVIEVLVILQLFSHPSVINVLTRIFVTAAALIVSWVAYFKDRESEKLLSVVQIGFLISYAVIMFLAEQHLVFIYAYAVAVLGLFYDKTKSYFIYCYLYIGIIAVKTVYLLATMGNSPAHTDVAGYLMELVVSIIFFMACSKISRLKMRYGNDIFGKLDYEAGIERNILKDLKEITAVVRDGSAGVNDMMSQLGESTTAMNNSLKEIGESTKVTAENIQEQTVMTKDIQDSIMSTRDASKNMVDIATESNELVNGSMETVKNIEAQSAIIADVNAQVAKAMEQLQNKAAEVRNIADMIFEISSQTNLLALNASIESARAGEAGRGFAVVADQIRQLAEQTRSSTESISSIISELNDNANEVADKVTDSASASAKQGELIVAAASDIQKLDTNINTLTENVDHIDGMLENLLKSNDTIVENISQLSATSEEVTASADLVSELSEDNLKKFTEVNQMIDDVVASMDKLDKYL